MVAFTQKTCSCAASNMTCANKLPARSQVEYFANQLASSSWKSQPVCPVLSLVRLGKGKHKLKKICLHLRCPVVYQGGVVPNLVCTREEPVPQKCKCDFSAAVQVYYRMFILHGETQRRVIT